MSQATDHLTSARELALGLAKLLTALKDVRLEEGKSCRELGIAHQGLEACQYWLGQQAQADLEAQAPAPPSQPTAA